MADLDITGMAELEKALQAFPDKFANNVMRGAMRAGVAVVATEARRLLQAHGDVDSGQLLASIRTGVKFRGDEVRAYVIAGDARKRFKVGSKGKTLKGDAAKDYQSPWYAYMIEVSGAKPHEEKPKGAKSLFLAGINREIVNHPGFQPKPFMRPAIDGKAQEALEAIRDYIAARIDKELAP